MEDLIGQVRQWAERHGKNLEKPPAILLDMGVPGLALARHLGRRGVSLLGLDTKNNHWSHKSRYIEVISSAEMRDSNKLFGCIEAVHEHTGCKPVVFGLHDDYARTMARHAGELKNFCYLPLTDSDVMELLIDKDKAAEVCNKLGIATPLTVAVSQTRDIEHLNGHCRFPAIIKPVESRRWQTADAQKTLGGKKAVEVQNTEDLKRQYDKVAHLTPKVIVQEVVPGPDSNLYYVVSYVDRKSRPIGFFVGQKIRTFPPGFGRGCWVRSVANERVAELARQLIAETGYKGNIGVEFKYDERDDSYKLIEINCRFGLWDGFAEDCNVKVASSAYADLAGLPLPEASLQKSGAYWLNPESDVWAARTYIRTGEISALSWIGDYLRPHFSASFTWDDPLPGIFLWGELFASVFRRVGAKITRH